MSKRANLGFAGISKEKSGSLHEATRAIRLLLVSNVVLAFFYRNILFQSHNTHEYYPAFYNFFQILTLPSLANFN